MTMSPNAMTNLERVENDDIRVCLKKKTQYAFAHNANQCVYI